MSRTFKKLIYGHGKLSKKQIDILLSLHGQRVALIDEAKPTKNNKCSELANVKAFGSIV